MGKNILVILTTQLLTNSIYQLKYNPNRDLDVLWVIILFFSGIGTLASFIVFIFKNWEN